MSLLGTIRLIKRELYKETVVFVRVGAFYNVYFDDAIIISFLLGYKLKVLEGDVKNCGFPEGSLKNIKFLLKEKEIDYIVIDDTKDYEGCEREKFGDENSYAKCYFEALKFIKNRERIEAINKVLLDNINNPAIEKMLDAVDNAICVV